MTTVICSSKPSKFFIPKDIKPTTYLKEISEEIYSLINKDSPFLEFSNHPPTFLSDKKKFTTLKERRKLFCTTLDKRMRTIYEDDKYKLLQTKPKSNFMSMTTPHQNKYSFLKNLDKIVFSAVEVDCRMVSLNNSGFAGDSGVGGGGLSTRRNVSRMGAIAFKGDLKKIMDNLLEKCKTELCETYSEKISEIHQSACYIPDHKPGCMWECCLIETNLRKNWYKYSDFFDDSSDNNYQRPLCFHMRQVLGQGFLPYIKDDKEDLAENKESMENEEDAILGISQEEYLFDNFFIESKSNALLGVKKHRVNCDAMNFLDLAKDECTALLTFQLGYIGVTRGGMNLYLKILNCIYCTDVKKQNELPNAKDYLENMYYKLPAIRNYLDDKYKMEKKQFNICLDVKKEAYDDDDDEEEYDHNKEDDDDDDDGGGGVVCESQVTNVLLMPNDGCDDETMKRKRMSSEMAHNSKEEGCYEENHIPFKNKREETMKRKKTSSDAAHNSEEEGCCEEEKRIKLMSDDGSSYNDEVKSAIDKI